MSQWGCILGEEYGEFLKEVNDGERTKALTELVEVAAVCLRIAEVYFAPNELMAVKDILKKRTENQKEYVQTWSWL